MEILIIIIFILLLYGIQTNSYIKYCFKGLEINFSFEEKAIFEGEKTNLKEVVINKKWMPLWWIRVQYLISSNIEFENEKENRISALNNKSEEFTLLGFEKIERKVPVKSKKRGCYKLLNMDVLSADLFVTNKIVKKYSCNEELYVFPRLLSGIDFNIKFEKLIGDVITKKQLINDPYEVRGIRDYNPYDSMKDINWLASAKTLDIKVNQYNYTTSGQVIIFLSSKKENSWVNDEIIEEGIRIAATLCSEFSNVGIEVKLITDCKDSNNTYFYGNLDIDKQKDSSKNIFLDFGSDQNHTFMFNGELSKIDIDEDNSNNEDVISKYIEEEITKGNINPLWIVISNNTRRGVREAINKAKENNFDVRWVIPKEKNADILMNGIGEVIIWDVSI